MKRILNKLFILGLPFFFLFDYISKIKYLIANKNLQQRRYIFISFYEYQIRYGIHVNPSAGIACLMGSFEDAGYTPVLL